MESIANRLPVLPGHASRRQAALPCHGRQRGAFALMTAVLLLVVIGMFGLALDLGRMFHRKIELQSAAEAIAMAAAKELDGTVAGVTRARTAAMQAAAGRSYNYLQLIGWSENAIQFSALPDGASWLDAASAGLAANASTMFYARVNTNLLDAMHGDVQMYLLRMVPAIGDTSHIASAAIAGRASTNVLPMAICAMSDDAGAARGTINELVEYGFRRGVSYDVMQLNPHGDTGSAHYLIDPLALPGQASSSMAAMTAVMKPFVCTGTVGIPVSAGSHVKYTEGFPLPSLYEQFNSRFGSYTAPCLASSAPPDTNIKQFDYLTQFAAMDKAPTAQSAETRKFDGKMITVADVPLDQLGKISPATAGGMYGPLWIYARAVISDSKYVSGSPEPAGGYTKFSTNQWQTLYGPDQKVASGKTYPSTPYTSSIEAPVGVPGVALRRLLYIPLLRCTAGMSASGTTEVRAIAKFFMTVPATKDALYAEFAGLVPPTALVGQVRLYP
jgi:hypothetical protein